MSTSGPALAPAADRSAILGRYEAARDYIDRELVRLLPRRRDPEGKVRTARAFNARLGDPQRAFPSVQVAGTSGKGSVTVLIAESLRAAGLRAGYHVSPYLQAFTEKSWIDGRYLSVEGLEAAVDELRPVADAFAADPDGPASVHGLASLAVSWLAFRNARLDLAVVETGLGGRFDLVQGLERELSVITDLGLDHTQALGPTIEEIAWHKAGIIEPGVPCVAVRGTGWEVIEAEARKVGAPLVPVDMEGGSRFRLASDAPFLARNAAVAAAALDTLAGRGWPIRPVHLEEGFRTRIPGRFERVQNDPPVILDVAHNPQKIAALVEALGNAGSRDLTVLLAATGSRPPDELLAALAPVAALLVATELDLHGKSVVPAAKLAATARRLGLEALAVSDPEAALDEALLQAGPSGALLITGSVYVVGLLRSRWHPADEVVLQGTSWPRGQ